jgi:hypothetical protein
MNFSPAQDVDAIPAAIVPLQRLGIQRFDEEVKGLTVDAAEVNPATEPE